MQARSLCGRLHVVRTHKTRYGERPAAWDPSKIVEQLSGGYVPPPTIQPPEPSRRKLLEEVLMFEELSARPIKAHFHCPVLIHRSSEYPSDTIEITWNWRFAWNNTGTKSWGVHEWCLNAGPISIFRMKRRRQFDKEWEIGRWEELGRHTTTGNKKSGD